MTIRLHVHRVGRVSRVDRAPRARRGLAAVALGAAVLANGAVAARADSVAQLQPQVFVAQPGVRFVVVSAAQGDTAFGDLDGCSGNGGATSIELPNGTCGLGGVRITNGDAASTIEVSATDFIDVASDSPATPAQNGLFTWLQVDGGDGSGDTAPWRLCSVAAPDTDSAALGAPQCDGTPGAPYSGQFPGPDQVWLTTTGAGPTNTDVTSVGPEAGCDTALTGLLDEGGCVLAPDATAVENLQVTAPWSTTDHSYTFASAITWTALPPS